MRIFLYGFLLLLTVFSVYQSSFFVREGEVDFHADIARDFLLLDELDHKKIVFIGPRSNTNGLFHGPFWTYINYPSYVLGNGNPVTVAWFWILLEILFLISSFFIAKKLFGILPAFFYILLLSTRLIPHMNRVFHAEAAFFVVPLLFFSITMYIKNKKSIYLVLHLLALSILTQLNIGVGIQFIILSGLLIFWFIIKRKLYKHLFAFALLPLFLSNFIIFDLRHQLLMSQALFSTGNSWKFFMPFADWLGNRINNTISLQLVGGNYDIKNLSFLIFVMVIIFTIIQIKRKSKYKQLYMLFLFYYFGYMVLSIFNKGIILYHHVHFLIPLTTLWLVSFVEGKSKLLFLPLVCIVFVLNLNNATAYIDSKKNSIRKDYNSWKSLSAVANDVIAKEKGKEFGYFVFAPDSFAYQPRYAMQYHFKASHAKAFEYVKKPTTYIIAGPPPANDPYMNHIWWRKYPVKIASEPKETKKFPNGFTIEKFSLSKKEQNIPHDKAIELGIHFR